MSYVDTLHLVDTFLRSSFVNCKVGNKTVVQLFSPSLVFFALELRYE